MNLGTAIDKLWSLREKKRKADELAKQASADYNEFESEVLEQMSAQSTFKASGKKATFSTRQSLVPTVHDWDKFHAYIARNKAFFLLERRPAVTACRELFETKGISLDQDGHMTGLKQRADMLEKWGIEPFVKVSASLTTLKS